MDTTDTTDYQPPTRAHVLLIRPDVVIDQLTLPRASALASGQTEAGRTDHLIVYTDGTPQGDATAQTVLQTCEADYLATQAWFGGIDLPPGQEGDDQTVPRTATPVQVLIDPQAGGAYHFGCDATDLYIEPTPELASGLVVAELVEIFEAAINNGWDCGRTNGEGLSRVLASERNANLGSIFVQSEQSWWANGYADYVSDNTADDSNQDANGCATLFLFYLHSQLGYDWGAVATTGGSSLSDTFQRLTGQDPASGFSDFLGRLATLDAGDGVLNVPQSGNPFPISNTAPIPAPSGAPQPEPVPAGTGAAVVVEREVVSVAPAAEQPASPPPVAALEPTAPIRPRRLGTSDASGAIGWAGRGTLGVLALVALLLLVIIGLIATGVIHLF